MDPEKLKGLGNDALKNKNFPEAIQFYTEAIKVANEQHKPTHVYYSNRAAAEMNRENYKQALADASDCIDAKPDWPKGYVRKGAALHFLKRYAEAEAAYKDGLTHDPNNQALKDGLDDVKPYLTGPSGSQDMGSPFGDPQAMMQKLMTHPETKEYFKDPSYLQMLGQLQKNPQNMMQFMSDPRMMKTFGVLTGIDLGNLNQNAQESASQSTPYEPPKGSGDSMDTSETPVESKKTEEPKLEEMMEDEIDDEEDEEALRIINQKKQAEEEKAQGTAAYKKKEFDTAHAHYAKAFELDPTNLVYLSNSAAVSLEQKNFDQCREFCNKAVECGRENRGDFKMIAKALSRIGTSYEKEAIIKKKEDNLEAYTKLMEDAECWYNKSLSEFRDKSIVDKVNQIKKKKKEAEKQAYYSLEEFDKSKALANEFFKHGTFPDAIKHYNDCLKRRDDAKKENHDALAVIYCNRAACYTKLMEFPLAVSDCDKAIKFNPKYIKGYLRKGTALEAMRRNTSARDEFQKALDLDSSSVEAQQGFQRCMQKSYEERNDPQKVRERAEKDPEVQAIMSDPSMRMILEQMQRDPNALKDHLQNPEISAKIQKLIDVGIISVGHR